MFKSQFQTSFENPLSFSSFPNIPLQTTRVSSVKSIQPLLLSRATQLTSSYTSYLPKQTYSTRTYIFRQQKKILNIKRLPDILTLHILVYLNIQQLVALVLATEGDSRLGKTVRKVFEDKLVRQTNSTKIIYSILNFCQQIPMAKQAFKGMNPQSEDIIKLDSERTFLKKQNQQLLSDLLSKFCKQTKIKYLQGMNQVAAHILTTISSKENASKIMFYIYIKGELKFLMSKNFSLLKKLNKEVERQIRTRLRPFYEFLEYVGVPTDVFTSKWFLTLFTGVFTGIELNRVWLLFFLWGFKVMVQIAFEVFRNACYHKVLRDFDDLKEQLESIKNSPSRQNFIVRKTIESRNKTSIFSSYNQQQQRNRGLSLFGSAGKLA